MSGSMIFMLLFGVGLGWLFTVDHYSHKSQNAYFYLGHWWTSSELERLRASDREMLKRIFN
jgi:hypothetical protein